MQGFQLTFFTRQDRKHGKKPLCDWLLEAAREAGMHGATVVAAAKGFGHSGHLHSASFFELADQPQQVVMIATAEQSDRLLARIESELLPLFYVKTPVEFGMLGPDAP